MEGSALVLTEEGFRPLSGITEGTSIMTMDTETQDIAYNRVKSVIVTEGDTVYSFRNRNLKGVYSKDDRFLLFDRHARFFGYRTAKQVYERDIEDISHKCIPSVFKWNGKGHGESAFLLEGVKGERLTDECMLKFPDRFGDRRYDMKKFIEFVALFLFKGSIYPTMKDIVFLYEGRYRKREIYYYLNVLGFKYRILYKKGYSDLIYIVQEPRLNQFLWGCDDIYTFFVPRPIMELSTDWLWVFYTKFFNKSGRLERFMSDRDGTRNYMMTTLAKSERLAWDLCEIVCKLGYSPILKEDEDYAWRFYNSEALTERERNDHIYRILFRRTPYFFLDKRLINIQKGRYTGKMYALEVENNTNAFILNHGRTAWVGTY